MTPIEQQVWDALTTVIDPELNVSIVDLGLIYEVEVDDQGCCSIKMSLTTPGCPLSSFLQNDIERAAEKVPAIRDARVQLVWYPVWSIARMSSKARRQLGIGGSLHDQQNC
ncbi:MAG: metal-sulfur cluster assembly factor [Limosilactobacillus mucosae]